MQRRFSNRRFANWRGGFHGNLGHRAMQGSYAHPLGGILSLRPGPMPVLQEAAFNNSIATYSLSNTPDTWTVFDNVIRFEGVLRSTRRRFRNVRVAFEMSRDGGDSFSVPFAQLLAGGSTTRTLRNLAEAIENKLLENYPEEKIVKYKMTVLHYLPTSGASSLGEKFPVPDWITKKRSVINVRTSETDQDCFRLCILYHLHCMDDSSRRDPTMRPFYSRWRDELTWLTGPVSYSDRETIERVERETGRGIFIYGIDTLDIKGQVIVPLRVSKRPQAKDDIDILFIDAPVEITETGEAASGWQAGTPVGHFLIITDINTLLKRTPKSDQAGTSTAKCHLCKFCFHQYSTAERLAEHLTQNTHTQLGGRATRISLPDKDQGQDIVSFKNHGKKHPYPFILVADTECTLVPVTHHANDGGSCRTQRHVMNSFCISFLCADYNRPLITYHGEDAADKLVQTLREVNNDIVQHYSLNSCVGGITADQHNAAEVCTYCRGLFTVYDKKVRDVDCEIDENGKYCWNLVGSCHSGCARSKKNWKTKRIKVYFHNAKSYDSHLLLSSWVKSAPTYMEEFDCIPENGEKFKMFTVSGGDYGLHMEINDSLAILDAGLATLVGELKYPDDFGPVKDYFQKKYPDNPALAASIFEAVTKKGIYPYEYVSDFSVFDEPQLPPIESFYSSLRDETVSEDEYAYAQRVFSLCCNNFLDYHMLYLITDVLLLQCCITTTRNLLQASHSLDICNYMSLPAFTYDAMLKYTGVSLGIPDDVEVHEMGDLAIRGGLCNAIHRHSVSTHDSPTDPHSLCYIDANNLYGYAMSQPLPTGDSEWMDVEGETLDQMQALNSDSIGVMVQCDWEIPHEVHDKLADLPPFPGLYSVGPDEFSEYHKRHMSESQQKRAALPRLVLTLYDKKDYICTLEIALLYQSIGARCTKIKRALVYARGDYMKQYITLNTLERQAAAAAGNTAAVSFFKKLNNSVFGKMMERVKHRQNVNICLTEKEHVKWASHCTFRRASILTDNCTLVVRGYTNIVQTKNLLIGAVLLDHSKELMYKFFYQVLKPYFPMYCKLLYMDTDSLILELGTDNVYREFSQPAFADYMDMSGLKHMPGKEYGHDRNKKVPGYFADESDGERVIEFVALGSKVYSIATESSSTTKQKGIDRGLMKKQTMAKMRESLLEPGKDQGQAVYHTIRSKQQQLYTERICKKWYNPNDTKRYILPDGINTLPHGHFRIKQIEAEEPEDKRRRVN